MLELQIPSDLVPASLMTNAIVGKVEKTPVGDVLELQYKDNEAEIAVGPATPVVGDVPADAGLLKPGAAIFVIALKKPNGTLTSARVTAEKDGVRPPM